MLHAKHTKTVIFLAAILYASGCQSTPIVHSEDFAPDDQPKAINRILDVQAARGARADGTLYAMHFDGPNLNALGMSKLDLMLKDDTALPLYIWMDLPQDDAAPARRAAVGTYLKDKGLAPQQIIFGDGPNHATDHPAVRGIRDLGKTDSDPSAGAGGGASDANSSPATPGASGSH